MAEEDNPLRDIAQVVGKNRRLIERVAVISAGLAAGPEAAEEVEALGEALPEYLPVDSSFITAIGFTEPGIIEVWFKASAGGKSYTYTGTRELFDQFAAADSKGQFFNANIR